jgi:transcription elongation factor/antiterminator RfaH
MITQWYVLHVKPHKERAVTRLLQAREVDVYFPVLKVKPVNPRSRKERPFFPGYLFVQIDLADQKAGSLQWVEGTHGLVQIGGEPARVPEQLIQALRQRLDDINAAGGLARASLKRGDRVRIVSGPFEGYEAIFDVRLSGKDRVQVLLTFLNDQPKRLQLDVTDIEKVKDDRG